MMERIRKWLSSTAGRVAVVVLLLPAIGAAVWSVYSFSQGETDFANYKMYICTQTGKAFRHRNEVGESLPIYSPFSGKNTGVPAEACYWTKDGKIKSEPTWVLVKEFDHKPGPTFCPDCGRLVVGHNPYPTPGMHPPPTEAEWNARHPDRSGANLMRDDSQR
ncbi:MAG TPA: hypothetical protein VGI81_27600 [Tepidisphaeraceae bacterium]|jgi:hypothetical protein